MSTLLGAVETVVADNDAGRGIHPQRTRQVQVGIDLVGNVARLHVLTHALLIQPHALGRLEDNLIGCTSSEVLRQVGFGFSGELASSGVDT
jgi:hypothetical protein